MAPKENNPGTSQAVEAGPDRLRLQVFLSRHGVCSRRQAMEWVKQGRVSLNGKVTTEPSTPVVPGQDKVAVNGRPVGVKKYDYVMLNKPCGVVTTCRDRHARRTVLDLLPKNLRHLRPVGRLDKDSEGLLLLTNDGDLLYRLTHPSFESSKTYLVHIDGLLTDQDKVRLEKGIELDGSKTAKAQVRLKRVKKDKSEFEVTIHEGRNRQIRRMLSELGHRVVFLQRVRQGPLVLGALPPGAHRPLTPTDIRKLKERTSNKE